MATKTTARKTRKTTAGRNWTVIVARVIVIGFAAAALSISFSHIIELALLTGVVGWQAYASPLFVDGIMLLGRLGMSPKLDASTNRIGRAMLIGGGLLSLTANIAVGQSHGQRVLGAMVVGAFLLAEWYAGRIMPRPLTPAQKAAATRAANAAKKTRTRKSPTAKTISTAALLVPASAN